MKKTNLKNLTLMSLFCALMCASAIIYIPLVVPITLQTLIIALCCELMGTKKSIAVYFVYVAIGFCGLPVFSGFNSGFSALFSNTGGFIIGFFVFILVKGATKKLFKNKTLSSFVSSLLALISLYIVGSVWFTFIYYESFSLPLYAYSLVLSVLPFVLPDVLKIAVSIFIAKRIKKFF